MSFNPRELYSARKKENTETFAPYIRYVAQSGLLLVIAFLGIVFIDQYIKLIRYTPVNFPLEIVVTIVVGLCVLYSPYRTFLKPADIIYVMPKQAEMKQYFNACSRRGFIISLIPLIIVTVLAYFLIDAYRGKEYVSSVIFIAIFMKLLVYHAFYNINELTNKTLVILIKLCVTVITFVSIYSVFNYKQTLFIYIIGYVVIGFAGYYTISQTSKFVNWQQMIDDEQRKIHRTYRFLNLFVDIPNVHNSAKKRSYLAKFAEFISYKRKNTFAYLHYLTFARSEIGGIYVRNIIVGSVIAVIMAYTMLWDGYAALMFTVIFMGVNAVQLTTLRLIHRHSVWQNIYPIRLEEQHKQMTSIEIKLLFVSSFILASMPSLIFVTEGKLDLVGPLGVAFVAVIVWRMFVIRNIVNKQLR